MTIGGTRQSYGQFHINLTPNTTSQHRVWMMSDGKCVQRYLGDFRVTKKKVTYNLHPLSIPIYYVQG